ncbi:MAG: GNAT family N-acetyltransferase [Verrucomicrobiales bacterium]|nr:GNAT family N-acetyltransferase [Verrucomicrobiales bacterium]
MSRQLRIRPLREADLAFADSVREIAGWNQTLTDWRRFLSYESEGCFLAEWDGNPAATITTTRYPGGLAWIGMMLVHPDFRRRGIATALMEHAIQFLREIGATCIKLDATPEGEPVYERLGFQAEPGFTLARWVMEKSSVEESIEAIGGGEKFVTPEFDRLHFGDDRSDWLAAVAADARDVIVNRNRAFGMLRAGSRADYLGPVSAISEESGVEMTRRFLDTRLRRTTFWDVPDANETVVELAKEFGFEKVRILTRMWTGEKLIPSDPQLHFGLVDPACG